VVTLGALAALALLAWLYLLATARGPMAGMGEGFLLVALMWAIMMVAMMIPSAAPAVLLYARVQRQAGPQAPPPTAAFLAGYLLCWLAFALAAAALQVAIERLAPASLMMTGLAGTRAGAIVIVAVGLYQLSPLKDSCLARCRSPAAFLSRHYRPGAGGALRLGLLHGLSCVGCCWLLMALLFVVGVMNLAWIAALTLLVAAEKLLPHGRLISRLAAAALLVWGAALLLGIL
jgi:predicted metal-binding membrane protein